MKNNALGLVEAFYGRTWSDAARLDVLRTLATAGYQFYLYAPKAERKLRAAWREPWTDEEMHRLSSLASHCRREGLDFGVGLSPMGLTELNAAERASLGRKLEQIAALKPSLGCLLFDDLQSTGAEMASQQLAITDWVAGELGCAQQWLVCPSYYSSDPILEKVFGAMPKGYWDTLGRGLDASIDLFWTGEQVCSREIAIEGLEAIAERFRRRPVLWDNYPVNDGERLSQHLHLKPFSGRPAALADYLRAHYANPMNQAYLSLLPLLSLPLVYQGLSGVEIQEGWARCADALYGEQLASCLRDDLVALQETGLGALSDAAVARLQARYIEATGPDEPAFAQRARQELREWLAGEYAFDPACLTDG